MAEASMDHAVVAPDAPLLLDANQPLERPYRGGAGIARFRGTSQPGEYAPEDFVGSITEVHGGGHGLTRLPDGRLLRDAIAADPIGFLGEDHTRRHGANTLLLVKLLDTAERLFVHFHPDDRFASTVLHEPRGKTEAWAIVDVEDGVDGYAAVGFSRPVSPIEVGRWFDGQDVPDMLGAMHRVPLQAGSTLLVPAGIPHSIGPGITLVELQQPADLSILLEYRGYRGLDATSALMGLNLDEAIDALDRHAWSAEEIASLMTAPRLDDSGREWLFPEQADPFFRAERIVAGDRRELEAAFSLLVVLRGEGALEWAGGRQEVRRGDTVLVPHGAGPVSLSGSFEALRALPPA
ncbi:class I mannose-6-phosphate isomerase [Microbacterium tumbae]